MFAAYRFDIYQVMRPTELPHVRSLALFADLGDAAFERLMRAAYLQRFPAGMELIARGGRADFLHVVVEGCVEMRVAHEGRETTIALVRPVSAFIVAAVLLDAPHLMSAHTAEASSILLIPASEVREVFAGDAGFARAVVRELAFGYRSMVKELGNQKLRTGTVRLANRLLRLAAECGEARDLTLPVDKRRLAALVGMTPENLSRAFAALAQHGVEMHGRRVILHDAAALRAFAAPHPLIDDPTS